MPTWVTKYLTDHPIANGEQRVLKVKGNVLGVHWVYNGAGGKREGWYVVRVPHSPARGSTRFDFANEAEASAAFATLTRGTA